MNSYQSLILISKDYQDIKNNEKKSSLISIEIASLKIYLRILPCFLWSQWGYFQIWAWYLEIAPLIKLKIKKEILYTPAENG